MLTDLRLYYLYGCITAADLLRHLTNVDEVLSLVPGCDSMTIAYTWRGVSAMRSCTGSPWPMAADWT